MGRIQTACHSTWRYLLGPFTWFEWANPGWDPSHKTLFRFHFTEKDNRNMHLNLLSLQRQILINVSFRLGKIGLYYRTLYSASIHTSQWAPFIYLFYFWCDQPVFFYFISLQYLKAFSCSPFPSVTSVTLQWLTQDWYAVVICALQWCSVKISSIQIHGNEKFSTGGERK